MPHSALDAQSRSAPEPASASDASRRNRPESNADSEELLSLLSDEHARTVLEEIVDEPMPATEIAERIDVSRPTVYRRLNRLEDAGLVESTMVVCSGGHHYQEFRGTLTELHLSFDGGGFSVDHAA